MKHEDRISCPFTRKETNMVESWFKIIVDIVALGILLAVIVFLGFSIFGKKEPKTEGKSKSCSNGSHRGSQNQGLIGPNETDGSRYCGGPRSGVDYPSSWHDSNTPGGSLDI
jgi:hypothetical protein